jgi:site-specific DNA-cytosine methylase
MINGTHGWSLTAAVTDSLDDQPNRMWPTPRASNGMNDSMHSVEGQLERKGYKSKLEQAVCMFPTPTARDWKGARKPETLKKKGRTASNSLPDKIRSLDDTPKTLNPSWVEWLMGFPINHTSIDEEDEVHANVSYWDIEPDMPRVGSKVNNRKDRLKCMGNAVVPQCVAVIAECIKEVEDENNNN